MVSSLEACSRTIQKNFCVWITTASFITDQWVWTSLEFMCWTKTSLTKASHPFMCCRHAKPRMKSISETAMQPPCWDSPGLSFRTLFLCTSETAQLYVGVVRVFPLYLTSVASVYLSAALSTRPDFWTPSSTQPSSLDCMKCAVEPVGVAVSAAGVFCVI